MEPAPQGGVVVLSAPKTAGQRGRITERKSAHDWDEIVAWHRERPGIKARYGTVPSNLLTSLKTMYPDTTFDGHNHHHQHDSRAQKDLRKVCDVYVTYEPDRQEEQ
jgi:hypothetical protein